MADKHGHLPVSLTFNQSPDQLGWCRCLDSYVLPPKIRRGHPVLGADPIDRIVNNKKNV